MAFLSLAGLRQLRAAQSVTPASTSLSRFPLLFGQPGRAQFSRVAEVPVSRPAHGSPLRQGSSRCGSLEQEPVSTEAPLQPQLSPSWVEVRCCAASGSLFLVATFPSQTHLSGTGFIVLVLILPQPCWRGAGWFFSAAV